ncbi:MAG: GDP-mannose-dependent alpha-(1-6)-phosphatidylinositol monomannoside mannosyltransferase [Candidatus Anoxychlamydiales bacterium]|nr:GDP-mannose-dependent alpha-(1-6)-phosphatidylinositol monomannoside mannosyltransferase [Candidatus Anoxychlamydiales bacterium]
MKTAIVHDWLVSVAGGEKVVQSILEIFPSDIFTLLKNDKNLKNTFFENKQIFTSFIQKLPFSIKKHSLYLPFFPMAIEQFDLREYNVVFSSSSCVAKGVLTDSNQLHICYCHTPIRYAWDLYHQYLEESNFRKGFKGMIAKFFLHYLRMWDLSTVNRVDFFIANSYFIRDRIKKTYNRESIVIYPPVDVNYFEPCFDKDKYYLTASRLVPYKKIDLIVEAFSKMEDKKLIVIGDGPEIKKIKSKAKKNIEILGYKSNEDLKKYMQKAKAFVFAAIEDFGITPVEAMACATPIIALNKGGSKETVINNETGIFFENQTIKDIIEAVNKFEKNEHKMDLNKIRNHSLKFSKERFKKEIKNFTLKKYNEKNKELNYI